MDADKDWYSQYFRDALPKLEVGGCFTAHNVSDRTSGRRGRGRGMSGTDEFVELLKATPNMDTEFVMRGGGLSVSYKSGG
jgi:predicted O-methyltransferase YrrM